MAQRYDIIHIDFQANARNANAAIESMRQESERCNKQVKDLQKKLKDGIEANLPSSQIQKLRDNLDAATKQARQFNKAYGELAKGMRVLDQGIKAFNDGSLATMNAAFQKAVYNAAKLTRSRLDRSSASYKKDREEMTALMDATQQYYASIQTDTQKVLDTISKGGKVSRQALTEELQQQKELLNVLSEKDRGYKRTVEQVATLEYELKKMGGSYEFVRKHITDTKRVSSETLRTMYTELEQTNRAGKVSTSIMRENKQAMKEIRAEQERRVQKVLGGNLGRQSEGDIRQAIASAKELIQVYGTSSKRAQTLAAQIVNAESYLKTVGVEGARAARQQADAALQAADKYKLMQDRMSNITKLSRGAFTETQRFWQEQLDGSKRGSTAYKEAERNLKALANEQQRLNTLQLQKSAKQLERKNLGLLSEKELQASIAAAKQLAQSMKPGDQAYKDLVNNIMRAEKYVKEFGLEGQRSSRMAVEQMQAMNDRMSHLSKLSDGALEETRKFWQAQMDGAERGSKAYNTYKTNLDAIVERQRKLVQAQNLASANKLMGGTSALKGMGEGEIRKAIDAAREYQKTLQADSDAYTSLSKAIFTAEEYLKQYGIEADKAKLKEEQLKATMTSRMTTLMTLSDSTLAETKKFWQSQMESAERTSDEYKQAAANLEKIAQVEQTHKASWGMRVMAKPENYGDAEIRQAVKAMEELRDAQAHGSKEWNHYNSLVEQGKKYLQEWAQVDSVVKFEGQMQKLTTLSDSALAETKKFWQGQVDSAAKGSNELKQYQVNLDKVKQEEAERRQLSNEMAVQKLGGNLGQLSESEIRQAIEAGKQLIQTYNTADPAAKKLAQQIVNAEQHLKQYGLEAERSAVREREAVKKAADERAKANQLMESQLQNSSSLTASALKAQESYWKRLIDDPKTAASSLSQYKANLDKVHLAQKLMMEDAGGKALSFFRNGTGDASAEEIRTQAEALKKYRDSLPQQTNADVIREINGYLAQTGQAAQGTAGPMMSLRDAFRMGLQGAANIFKGTPEQLKQAKLVLEETLATTEKGSHRYEQLRRALDGVALEEKRVGGVTKEMQDVLDAPKGRSFNELKMAVEQGRKALNDMSRTTKEGQKAYDELAEKVRNADLEMKNLGNTSKGTQNSFEKAVSRLKTYITLYMGTAVAIQKLTGAMGDMMTLSDKMGEVRKTTGFTSEEVGKLSDNLQKMDTRTPIQTLMELSAAAGQLGLNTEEDVRGFTEAANEMLVALPELGQDGATQMMKVAIATGEVGKIRKQMEQGSIQGSSATAVAMEKIASTVDRLRATTAAAAPPVTDFVKRVGAVGAQSGISIDQVAALGATVDELGMGTEMAATALSRMIPAIKQNAFSIAQAIGVKPETITQLYETGHAMDVILMILKHIRESNMNPDSVEKLLGTGGMADIMKELNQQGARAGIVFAGLSQNVDELERNLGTAKNAYEEGTAIMDEYNKMNDTTAAKWERLKNQMQEVLVNNSMQSMLGKIIDGLRWIVNLLTGNGGISVAMRAIIGYFALTKFNIGGIITGIVHFRTSLQKIGVALGVLDAQSKKAAMANIWTALAAAIAYCVIEIATMTSATREAYQALGKTREEIGRAETRFEGYWNVLRQTNNALNKATAQHNRLSKEVDKLRQSSDQGSKATAQLTKKQNELRDSEKSVTRATADRRAAIGQINSIYGKYLGFLLTERNYALLAASAHDKITAAIEREMLVKQKQASIDAVDSKYSSNIAKDYGELSDKLVSRGGLSRVQASSAMGALQTWMRRNIYYNAGKTLVRQSALQQLSRGGLDLRGKSAQQVAAIWMNEYLGSRYHIDPLTRSYLTGVHVYRDKGGRHFRNTYNFGPNLRGNYADTFVNRAEEEGAVSEVYNADINNASRNEMNASRRNLTGLVADAKRARSVILNKKSSKSAVSQAYGDLANALEGIDNNMQYLNPRRDAKAITQLRGFATSFRKSKGISSARLLKAQRNAHASMTDLATGNTDYSAESGGNTVSTAKFDQGEERNPWGERPEASSTNWSKFNADELVQRRKQMNDFVRALQGDTDVESVLSQDPALMKAVKSGKVKSDADSVINWYNTQRLAIQNVLHSHFLTNTGNWQDPKQAHRRAKSISKLVKDDMAYYMDELDAYYTEQKSQIEDAQNSGEITEEEGWRRMLQNEQVYRQKRAELQQLYSKNSKEVTQQEADTIYEILADRTGDSVAFIKSNIGTTVNLIKQVGGKSAPAMRKIYGDLDKGVEQDFLKMRAAVKKQLDAIEEIVSKERPFDGIVKNLRQNVEKMGLLYTDLDKRKEKILLSGKGYGSDEMQNLNAEYGTQRNPRLTFLLQQSEDAYNMTWERLVNNMRVSGFGDWADAILNNEHAEDMKEALLAQLRTVYDTVQDAIKREASEVKKQVEITWNDTTVVGDISMKQLYEKASSALGMEQSSVSRANSLINAGPASGRVADRLAIKQMQIQLNMQDHYYALVRKTGQQRIDDLERQAKLKEEQGEMDKAEQLRLDAKHAKMSLNLTLSEEEADLAKQRADLAAKAEESENRLYTSLREWGSLLSSSAKSVFEASVTGEADYYNSLAKMRLTGEGSAGGTYIITEHAGTKEAVSHYESLDGEDALKRQLEIEQKNATADAWKKVMDDVNSKINEQITDWMNAAMQNQAVDNNTSALIANTEALYATRPVESNDFTNLERNLEGMAVDALGNIVYPINPVSPDDVENPYQDENNPSTWPRARRKRAGLPVNENPFDNTQANSAKEPDDQWQSPWPDETQDGWNGKSWSTGTSDEQVQNITEQSQQIADAQIAASNGSAKVQIANNNKIIASTKSVNKANEEGTRSAFAKMTQAANLYGTAYQAMSNNNLSTSQKFQMFAVQAAGQAAITMLTTDLFQQQAKQTVQMPGILGKLLGEMPYPAAIATYAAVTALMGGLMALAVSQASKSKSQIAQATGANVSAGRLSTGMLTYAEGNVNEFTNPSSLTPGQRYNVDAADGKTYRARYMGANPTTHLTNGPEFHLVGERGREAIIDANTTRRLQMNDTGIWQAIQTLYNGGRVRATRQRGGGMSNFADGNLDEFADGASEQGSAGSAQPAFTDMLAAIQASLDRNSEVMEKAVSNGIKGVFNVYGKGGIIDSYDTGKKNVGRYGEKY